MSNTIPDTPTLGTGSIRPDAKDGTLEFWWEEPIFRMPPIPLSSYTLSCSSISFSQSVDSSITYLKISSLTNNIEYSFQITADNSNGSSLPSYFRTVQPGFVPNPIAYPMVTVISSSAVQVGWVGPTSDSSIPSTGWFVVESISSSPSDPVLRENTDGHENTLTISSLNISSQYAFNIYAVNDPGYSLAISTVAVTPFVIPGDIYTYFNIITVDGFDNYYYRIYDSQVGWGGPINTGIDSMQYNYNDVIGGGSKYLFGSFYNSDTDNYAIPFMNTYGTMLQTIIWNDDIFSMVIYPNSFFNNTFFSLNVNSETGLADLQLYQPNAGLYQSISIEPNDYFQFPLSPVPLQNSVIFFNGSASNTLLSYIWPVTESNPILLYESYGILDSLPYPVNSNTGYLNVAGIGSTDYLDTVNYITEPSTYMTYTLPESTYTNSFYPTTGPYGSNNLNSYIVTLYNVNTSLYDMYIWNNFSNSSNFLNPVILSNIGSNDNNFGVLAYSYDTYTMTVATNTILIYDIDSSFGPNSDNTFGIGTTYSVFDNGSTLSTSYTSTNLLFDNIFYDPPLINMNATGAFQLDDMNNVSFNLCSQEFGQSTYILSSLSAYRITNMSTSLYIDRIPYTNFMSFDIQLDGNIDGIGKTHFTFQTDIGAITYSTAAGSINGPYVRGSTGYITYETNGVYTANIFQNGVIAYSNVYNVFNSYIGSIVLPEPDLGSGILYGSFYDNITSTSTVLTILPDGPPTSTILELNQRARGEFASPSSFYACSLETPVLLIAQTLDNSQYVYSTYTIGSAGNTLNKTMYTQADSVLFTIKDETTMSTIYISFDETARTFREFTETNTIVQEIITTSPYYQVNNYNSYIPPFVNLYD